MVTPLSVTQIPCFSPFGDILSVSNRWGTWLERFDIFAHASGCTDDRQKHELLLHTASKEVQDTFATLADRCNLRQSGRCAECTFSTAGKRYFSETCFPPRMSES